MSRKPTEPMATLSICVSEPEHRAIRDAATAATMSVSSWGAARLVAGIVSPAARKAAQTAAARIAAVATPRGTRSGRVSMVVRAEDAALIKAAADKMGLASHALCQAIALDAAEREVATMPPAARRTIDASKVEARTAGTSLIRLPADLAGVDATALSEMLAALVLATSAKILDGTGKAVTTGVTTMAERLAKVKMVTVKVKVPELHFAGPAFVLGVPVEAYATTLAVKAARVLKASE